MGPPADNGFIDVFNTKPRAERLNAHGIIRLAVARAKLEQQRRHFNGGRSNSAIGNKTPISLMNGSETEDLP